MSVDKTDKDVSSRRAPPFIAVRCGIDKAHIYRYMKNVIYLQKMYRYTSPAEVICREADGEWKW